MTPVANPIKSLQVKFTRIQLFFTIFHIQSYKAFFTSEFFWWILQVNFSLKNSLEKF